MLLFFALLLMCGARVRHHFREGDGTPVNHYGTDQSVESSWTLTIRRTGAPSLDPDAFLAKLEPALLADKCRLYQSKVASSTLFLKLVCDANLVTLTPVPGALHLDKSMLYITSVYGRESVTLDTNKPMGWHNREWNAAAGSQLNPPWALDRIDARSGLDQIYQYENDASSVNAYVIDSGIQTSHVDFGGRATFLENTVGDGIDTDCLGHGTHVAGILGSNTYGVAKGVQLYSVKVLDCNGAGDTFSVVSGVLAAVEHAINSGRRGVINLSLGGERSDALDAALREAALSNLMVAVSAGNDEGDACLFSPSVLGGEDGGVLSVAASDIGDAYAYFSNYGGCVSVCAPGVNVLSTYIGVSNTETLLASGTSMGSPHAAGTGAILLHRNSALSARDTARLVKQWATQSVVSGATPFGGGKNLLYSLIPNVPPPPTTRSPTRVNGVSTLSPSVMVFIGATVLHALFMYI